MDLILFIMFSYGMYEISKDVFKIFLIEYTNVNVKIGKDFLVERIKRNSFYFGIWLFVIIGIFNKTDSLFLSFLFVLSLLTVITIELFYKKTNVYN